MSKQDIWRGILQERERQDLKWGGPKHDDKHGLHDWVAFIIKHLGKAVTWPINRSVFRRQMIRVAALAIAALEWLDR